MNLPAPTREYPDAVGSPTARERLFADLNRSVVRNLSSATFALSSLAARLQDPATSRQLLDSVEEIDNTISRIRAILLRAAAADALHDLDQPKPETDRS